MSIAFGLWFLPRLVRYVSRLPISEGVLTLAISLLLVFGISAEVIGGMAAITGSFLAGLMFSRTPEKEELEAGMHALAYSLFVPVFFISIGLAVNLRNLTLSDLGLVVVICLVAVFGKIIGAGFGAKMAGFSNKESLQLGTGMVSRGEVGLILATVGIDAGVMEPTMFSIILAMVLFTTIITPPSLRYLFRSYSPNEKKIEKVNLEMDIN